ncbi:MAG: hypothetical protein SNJ82_06770 [Gemmataceae bacterium]
MSLPRVEASLETLSAFATKVQPILLNACAKCHNPARQSQLQLRTPVSPGLADRRTIDHNLASLAALVDPARPSASPLLTKAVTIHGPGMVAPPLSSKTHAAALRTLEGWVHQLVSTTPSLRPTAPSTAVVSTPAMPSGFAALTHPSPATPAQGSSQKSLPPAGPAMSSASSRSPNSSPMGDFGADRPQEKHKEVEDPLGPDEFNRQVHPGKKPSETPSLPPS